MDGGREGRKDERKGGRMEERMAGKQGRLEKGRGK